MYRPTTLLPASLRLLLRVVDLKFSRLIDQIMLAVPVEQGGFLNKCSTSLQAFLLMLAGDHARSRGKSMSVVYLDLYKAFDTVNHAQLLEVLRSLGTPSELVDAAHCLCSPSFLGFYLEFPQQGGVFQGGPRPHFCLYSSWLILPCALTELKGLQSSCFCLQVAFVCR